MASIAKLYSDEIKKHFRVLYANWEPGGPIELGDYGIMDGNIFIPIGKLKEDFPEFAGKMINTTPDPTKDLKEFKSESGVEVNLLAKGSLNTSGAKLAKATLEIKFSKKDSIFFNAAECTTTRITNKAKVGEKLKDLMKQGKWNKEYCVVTDLVKAGRTIIAISQSDSSGISFEVSSSAIEKINLADASIELNITSEKSIGYKVDATDGMYILMGLCKIKNPFLWLGGGFLPKTTMMTESMEFKIENTSGIRTEDSVDELIFAQMGKD